MSEAELATDELWTLEDLARLWQAPGKTAQARRKWVWRRVHDWRVPHDGGRHPRFLPNAVRRATRRHLEGR